MSLTRAKRAAYPPGTIIYSVTGENGAISYTTGDTVAVHFAYGPTRSAPTRTPCQLLPEEVCWASSLPGLRERTYKMFQDGGEDALYRELESTYRAVFADTEAQR